MSKLVWFRRHGQFHPIEAIRHHRGLRRDRWKKVLGGIFEVVLHHALWTRNDSSFRLSKKIHSLMKSHMIIILSWPLIVTMSACAPSSPPAGPAPIFLGRHSDWVSALAFSPDGGTLASASSDHTVKLWDLHMLKLSKTLESQEQVTSVVFSPSGQFLASGGTCGDTPEGEIRIWDSKTGKEVAVVKAQSSRVQALAFSPSGKWLASGASNGNISVWTFPAMRLEMTFSCHKWAVQFITFARKEQLLISTGLDEAIGVCDLTNGQGTIAVQYRKPIERAALVGNGHFLAIGTNNGWLDGAGQIDIWQISNWQKECTLKGHAERVTSLAVGRDGNLLASESGYEYGQSEIMVWNVSQRKCLMKLHFSETNSSFSGCLAFGPKHNVIASGDSGGRIRLWFLENLMDKSAG